jgi:hypothetical protein
MNLREINALLAEENKRIIMEYKKIVESKQESQASLARIIGLKTAIEKKITAQYIQLLEIAKGLSIK